MISYFECLSLKSSMFEDLVVFLMLLLNIFRWTFGTWGLFGRCGLVEAGPENYTCL